MSVVCTKQFTMTIDAGFPTPIVYYKLDAIGGGGVAIDSVAARNTNINGGTVSVVGGQITNAYRLGLNAIRQRNSGDTVLNISAIDWTLRLWARVNVDVTDYHDLAIVSTNVRLILAPAGLAVGPPYVGPPPAGPYSQDRPYLRNPTSFTFPTIWSEPTTSATPMSDHAWHRIVVTWERTALRATIYIDQNAGHSDVDTVDPAVAGAGTFTIGDNTSAPANEVELCEVGLWGSCWTAAQMLYDWNGGAGRTYTP